LKLQENLKKKKEFYFYDRLNQILNQGGRPGLSALFHSP